MFTRLIMGKLDEWRSGLRRKPLVIRGARQVGKTTLVHQFAEGFEQYIYLNLELPEDRQPFLRFQNLEELLQTIFFLKNQSLARKEETLIFIDEIQEAPAALNILRYFYEQQPNICVIAAGSLLETVFDQTMHFPVGRVEFMVLRPASFPEFLDALGEHAALEQLTHVPFREFAHEKLIRLYHQYALVGGMPEIVKNYATTRDFGALAPLFDSLIASYMDDVEKYARHDSQLLHLRHVIKSAFVEAGKRIHFAGFGNSAYRSREMGECLRLLEQVHLLKLLYPCTSATLPLQPDLKKSPRLQVLDTGLLNYMAGIRNEIIGSSDLSSVYQGIMIEHLTGQELLANQYSALSELCFWTRERSQSTAEVDFLFPFNGQLIPIETKSGKTGTLRSLHQFMDIAPHSIALRFYASRPNISIVKTQLDKTYYLLSLPYYLASQTSKYLEWFQQELQRRALK
jgi:predicted AAA+ superfamily ATPase